jgi:hypothetical protein
MAFGILAADLKVNFLFNVKFHKTDNINAIKYAGQYGTLKISLIKVNEMIEITLQILKIE